MAKSTAQPGERSPLSRAGSRLPRACRAVSSEAGLAHVQVDRASCLQVEGRDVGRVAGGDDYDLVAPGLQITKLETPRAVGDVAGVVTVEEHRRAANVGLHDDGRAHP